MTRHEILYNARYTATPLSFWVHHNLDKDVWIEATQFDPPLPEPVAGKGWPMLAVEVDGLELFFASAQELHHFMLVISKTPMPTAAELSAARGVPGEAERHWLTRLPIAATSPAARKALFEALVEIAPAFVAVG